MAKIITKQINNTGSQVDIDSIAEQWARLILAQIESKKQKNNQNVGREISTKNIK